jgi:hypothetical protein
MTETRLAFDDRVFFGSREHFFHFMWGYLLPAVHVILTSEQTEPGVPPQRYGFRSCGPIMDPLIRETAALLGIAHRILGEEEVPCRPGGCRVVERWDIALMRLDRAAGLDFCGEHPTWCGLRSELERAPSDAQALGRAVRTVAQRLVSAALRASDAGGDSGSEASGYLILDRSPQPAYYAPGGPSEIPGYGTGRRSLQGVAATVDALRLRGLDVRPFRPGSLPLTDQIRVFSRCRGFVAIAGAEFANALWLPPGSLMIRVNPVDSMRVTPMVGQLAGLLDLRLHELPTRSGLHPMLDAEAVAAILGCADARPEGPVGRATAAEAR